jgi:predicted transglutaminase-like cysteine proteinase
VEFVVMWVKAGLVFIIYAILGTQAFGLDSSSKTIASETIFGKSLPPVGYVHFCSTGAEECKFKGNREDRIALSRNKWDMLNQVNLYVNGKIKPESDQDLYHVAELWAYPTTAGDCEDYVLLKKRYLQGLGFSPSQMLITVLLDEKGEGHAVLTLVTDSGDFILDNRRNEILRWDHTDYKFLKRQSSFDPKQWVSLRKTPTQVIVGAK